MKKPRMLQKEFVRDLMGFKVYRVCGATIRNCVDVSFTCGTNGFASKYCPKDEVWVDETLNGMDQDAIILHEVHEAIDMKAGMGYEEAHKRAQAYEKAYRKCGSLVKMGCADGNTSNAVVPEKERGGVHKKRAESEKAEG